MKLVYNQLMRSRAWRRGCGIHFLLCLLMSCCGVSCMPGAPDENSSHATLEISIEALYQGKDLRDGATVTAPAEIFIMPDIETTVAMHAGDKVTVDFYVDTNKLYSAKAVWRDAVVPSNRPGQFSPMIMSPAQFGYPVCDWTNGTAGTHTLTARASGLHGLSAISAPLQITILAPPAP